MTEEPSGKAKTWEIVVGLIVGLGSIATAGLAIVETYWG